MFNLNAPVPPASETEALNQVGQYQNSYNQAFSSQSQHSVEQTKMQPEQLQSGGQIFTIPPIISILTQLYILLMKRYDSHLFLGYDPHSSSVVGAFQEQSGGHQQPAQQGPGFGRQAQSFYNSRGMSRGGPRNARGMMNGYRGSTNGFRGKPTPTHYWYIGLLQMWKCDVFHWKLWALLFWFN